MKENSRRRKSNSPIELSLFLMNGRGENLSLKLTKNYKQIAKACEQPNKQERERQGMRELGIWWHLVRERFLRSLFIWLNYHFKGITRFCHKSKTVSSIFQTQPMSNHVLNIQLFSCQNFERFCQVGWSCAVTSF